MMQYTDESKENYLEQVKIFSLVRELLESSPAIQMHSIQLAEILQAENTGIEQAREIAREADEYLHSLNKNRE